MQLMAVSAYAFYSSTGISITGSDKRQIDRLILIAILLYQDRNPADGTFANLPATFLFMRGYTGHEHYDKFGLINMNARLYDPFLGRFLSPDPQVQAPDNGQNYNRYTYALNNPLKYTDPDGEFWHLVIGAAIGGTVNWLAHGAKFNAEGLKYFGIGALAGALAAGFGTGVSAALGGGSFGAGFLGTATKAASIGFESGFAIGFFSGATNGFVSGVGNSLANGDDLGSALRNGQKQMLMQGAAGALLGGIGGGISASRNGYGFWDGSLKLDPHEYEVYLASLGGGASPPPNPGMLDYSIAKEGVVAVHFYKWVRYENMYGDQVFDINEAFTNIAKNSTRFARGGEGFSSRIFNIDVGGTKVANQLSINFRLSSSNHSKIVDPIFLTRLSGGRDYVLNGVHWVRMTSNSNWTYSTPKSVEIFWAKWLHQYLTFFFSAFAFY